MGDTRCQASGSQGGSDAVAAGVDHGAAPPVRSGRSEWSHAGERALRRLPDQPQDRLRVARPLLSRGGPPPPPSSPPGRPQAAMDAPNAVWTVDFKGQFRLGDGTRCYPLTIADGYRRLLLSCRAFTSSQACESRPAFARAFQEYGLPVRIRSDNGVPFATQALGRLSPLSVWWVRLGILPDLIEPAAP